MAINDYETYVDLAVIALAADDHSTALTNLLAAKAAFVKVPDTEKDGLSARFRSGEIDRLIAECKQALGATADIQRTKITYVEATD